MAASVLSSAVTVLVVLFWISLVLLAWTHVLYPAFARALAAVRARPIRKADVEPTVTVIVAAYNEEASIARRIENLLELDYPRDKLRIVVSSDASTDRTEEIALQYPEVQVIANPKGGKVAAQDRAVRQTDSEIVAFSDANCTWSPDALRSSSARSPIRTSRTSAASCASCAPTGPTRRASTGATRWVCAAPSRARLDHRRERLDLRACAGLTTSRSTRASATTCRCRT